MAQAIQDLRPSTSRTLQGGLAGALKTALIWGSIAALVVGGIGALAAGGYITGIPLLVAKLSLTANMSMFGGFVSGALLALPWAAGIGGAVGFLTGANHARHQQKMEIIEAQQAAVDTRLQPGLARQVSFEGPGHPANDKRMEFTDMIAQQRTRQQGPRSV